MGFPNSNVSIRRFSFNLSKSWSVWERLCKGVRRWCIKISQYKKIWVVVSISCQKLQNGLRVSWKLWLNLWSLGWLKGILSLIKNSNPRGLWMLNIELDNGLMSLRIVFLRSKNKVQLWMLISSLLHSHITFRKNRFVE